MVIVKTPFQSVKIVFLCYPCPFLYCTMYEKFSVFSECLLIVITSVVSFLMMTYCCISHKWSQIMWSDAARECKYLKRYEVICITDKEQFCVHKGKYCRPELQQIKNTIAEAVRIHLPMKGNSQQVHLSGALLIACLVFF